MRPDPPLLTTERLIIRTTHPPDAPALLRYFEENRDHLAPYEPVRGADFYTLEHWRTQIARNQVEYEADQSLRLVIVRREAPEVVVGSANFTAFQRGVAQMCSLGYSVAAAAQGTGIMREALTPAIAFVFQALRMHRIQANYMPHNRRSGALLRRLGFVVEGYARDYIRIAGRWEDHVLASLTNPDGTV